MADLSDLLVEGWTRTERLTPALSRQDIARYGGVSGDVNLIHVDEPYALAAGHPGLSGDHEGAPHRVLGFGPT